jgi:ATP-binding cassette, subfamily F, member 3
MIQLQSASKRFGHKALFDGVDWMITPHDRVGLVGGNGTGKTTLLKIIGGLETIDGGEFNCAKGISIGYLPQDGLSLTGRTVFDECLSVFDSLKAKEREMEDIAHQMADIPHDSVEYHAAADRYSELESEFRNRDGYALEAKVGSVLAGLGFRKEDWSRFTEEFSGGWQMRIALAKLLLEQPDMLLLDEPTNHLDLEARNWLEGYLTFYPNAFVLISHDRYFLDITVEKIVELWNKRIHFYSGNYEKFLKQKEERQSLLISAYKNQQDRIEQLEAFITRFRYQATKAKQVQSRIKELEKIDRIEVPPDEKTIHFSFPQPKPSGRIVAEFHDVQKCYGAKQVFAQASFYIERGDRVALVGINGAGKSTLIKLLAGTEPLTSGEYKIGHNVGPDYFAQDQYKELDPSARLLDDLMSVANGKTITELRSLLGCFLFSEDDVFKAIGVLSGGERNRYALARMLLNPSNFLLLDEPTNHLDLKAKDVLLESLQAFSGTVVFVSHDRYFIDKLATRVFEIEDGEVRVFPGNYEDYLWRKQRQREAPPEETAETSAPAAASDSAKARKTNPLTVKRLEDSAKKLEVRSSELESKIAQLEAALASFVSAEDSRQKMEELDAARAELEKTLAAWEAASLQIEEIR